ncbi:uncharacterized protein [Euwallacea fornicatus]|uniref:uncharacterized protein n=1 Tax=Euwallacea fornicatus TaxID=995702 RepID=UPI00338F14EE
MQVVMKISKSLIVIATTFLVVHGRPIGPEFLEKNSLPISKKLLLILLKRSQNVCYYQDEQSEALHNIYTVVPVRIITNTHFLHFLTDQCDSYVFRVTLKKFMEIAPLLIPHTKVILFPNGNYNPLELNIYQHIYEHALQVNLIDFLPNQTIRMNYLMDNKTELIHHDSISMHKFYQQKWDPKQYFVKTGKKIIATTFHCPPFVEILEDDTIAGFEYRMVELLTETWPLHYNVIKTKSKNLLVNKFLIALDSIENKKSDIAFCFLWQRAIMERKLSFSNAMFPTCVTFLVHKPTFLNDYTFLFQTFRDIPTFVACVCSIVILEAIYKLWVTNALRKTKTLPFLSHRLCFISAAAFYFLFSSYYSAELTVVSRFPKFSEDYVKSFSDMIDRKIQWNQPQNDIQMWMKNTNDRTCMGIADNFRIEADEEARNYNLKQANCAFLVKRFASSLFSGAEELDSYGQIYLRVLPGCLATFYSSLGFPKNSPFANVLNERIYHLFASGLVNHWELRTSRKKAYRALPLPILHITMLSYDINPHQMIDESFRGNIENKCALLEH